MIVSSIHKLKGQDYFAQGVGQNWEAVVMADGISSTFKAEWAANFAVNALLDLIKLNDGNVSAQFFYDAFLGIPDKLRSNIINNFKEISESQLDKGFGTTLLCGVRKDQTYWFAYVGNGGIIHLRSRYFLQRTFHYPVPWSAINLLNPHTIEEDGQERLYRFISPRSISSLAIPTVLCISDQPNPADYFIMCTDGIFSTDHIPYTTDDENNVWLKYEQRLSRLYELIKENPSPTKVDLERYIANMNEEGMLDDDASVSVMWNL